jgi:hypothetical protein
MLFYWVFTVSQDENKGCLHPIQKYENIFLLLSGHKLQN